MELAENMEALVVPQLPLREDSPAADIEKSQSYNGSVKSPVARPPGNYKHNECVFVLGLPCNGATTA